LTADVHPIIDVKAQAAVAKVRAPQIRPRLQDACTLIVSEGLSIADAAKRSGMTAHSLQVALKKPHVRTFLTSVKHAWLESRTSKAWLNVAQLADSACSEDVRLKANRVFLEAAGELGAKGADPNATARTLVQIVVNAAQGMGNLTASQMPGVIEALPYQPLQPDASNFLPVGRDESEGEDDGE
jgi:hypothetical protein